jgi:hypothetical protein
LGLDWIFQRRGFSEKGLFGFLVEKIAECAGGAFLDLVDDVFARCGVDFDPRLFLGFEDLAESADTIAAVGAFGRFPGDGDFAVGVGFLFHGFKGNRLNGMKNLPFQIREEMERNLILGGLAFLGHPDPDHYRGEGSITLLRIDSSFLGMTK